ncbi:MAG: gamma-glutamylcyclotransferase family protein, partial [Gammaproteobacteria bacterium]
MASDLIFFYGSLLVGPADTAVQRALTACEPMGPAWIQGRLYDLGTYPGAVPSVERADRIRGVLYRLHDMGRSLRRLDRFEDYHRGHPAPSLYLRRRATAWRQADGHALICWVYFYNRAVQSHRRIA